MGSLKYTYACDSNGGAITSFCVTSGAYNYQRVFLCADGSQGSNYDSGCGPAW